MPNYAQGTPTTPLNSIFKGQGVYSFGAPTAVAIAAAPGGLSRTANVVTVTTSAAHGFIAGEIAVLAATTPTGATLFDGVYLIASVPSTTTFTALPLDPLRQHQANDTGGGGTAKSVAAENPAQPQSGQAFALAALPAADNPPSLTVDLIYQGAPTAASSVVQMADVDADANYVTVATSTTTTQTNDHVLVPANALGRFVRVRWVSQTGVTGITARINR